MAETKHTPGPWMVAGKDLPKCVVAKSDPNTNLMVWNEDQELAECASEADARLIAAAPDLLEALKEARLQLGAGMILAVAAGYARSEEAFRKSSAIVDGVIAKAEGRADG